MTQYQWLFPEGKVDRAWSLPLNFIEQCFSVWFYGVAFNYVNYELENWGIGVWSSACVRAKHLNLLWVAPSFLLNCTGWHLCPKPRSIISRAICTDFNMPSWRAHVINKAVLTVIILYLKGLSRKKKAKSSLYCPLYLYYLYHRYNWVIQTSPIFLTVSSQC